MYVPVSDQDNLLSYSDRVRSRAMDCVWGLGIGLGTGFMVRVVFTVCRPIGFRVMVL